MANGRSTSRAGSARATGRAADPLTIVDTASRYLIEVRITEPTWAGVRGALERTFEVNGLPDAIRSDNGAPFGSRGGGGLSSLAVWWLKLGIEPRYIPPGSPQHNGRHERLHRTLKDETTRPPAETACEQQRRFDAFRHYYNEDRPHEALDQTTPARHWQPSLRRLPDCPARHGMTPITRSPGTPERLNKVARQVRFRQRSLER